MNSPRTTVRARSRGPAFPETPPRWLAIAAVLLAAVVWSSSFAVTKVALAEVAPMTIGALRFVGAALLLGVVVHLQRERVALTPPEKVRIGVAGLLGITVYFALENVGVDLASASDATLIVASYPVITLVVELAAGRARFSLLRLSGMLLAVVGVWLVVAQGPDSAVATDRLLGDVLLLVGGIAWAAYNVAARRDSSGASPVVVTYYQTLAGAGGFVLLSLTEVGSWSVPATSTVLRLVFLAVFCSVVAFLAYNYGLRVLTASMAVNLLNIVPVLGLVWAVVLAGETLEATQVVGGAIVVVGVSIGLLRTRREREEDEHPRPVAEHDPGQTVDKELHVGNQEVRHSGGGGTAPRARG